MIKKSNLKYFLVVLFGTILFFSLSIFAQQPNIILPNDLRVTLQNQQQDYYQNYLKYASTDKPFISANIEYAMLEAQLGNQAAAKMAQAALTQQLTFVSQLSQSNLEQDADPNQTIEKSATLIKLFSYGYALWRNPQYLAATQMIDKSLISFLKIPECLTASANQLNGTNQQQKVSTDFIDKHILTRQIGMLSDAIVHLYMVTDDPIYLQQATNAVQWVIDNRNLSNGGFCHEIINTNNIYLDDNLAVGKSLLSLYQATGNRNYLSLAQQTAYFINNNFNNTQNNIGFLSRKALNNAQIDRDENAQLARFANLLYYYTGNKINKDIANQAMRYLIQPDMAKKSPIAVILLTNRELSQEPLHLTIIGRKNDVQAQNLYAAALAFPSDYKRIEWYDKNEDQLLNNNIEYPHLTKAAAFVCNQNRCSLPIFNSAEIAETIIEITHYVPLESEASYDAINNTSGVSGKNILSNFNNNLPVTGSILHFSKSTHPLSAQEKATILLKNNNWFLIVPAFFIFGLLLAFTPCVLPMVPILVSIIAGQGKTLTTRKAFLLSLTYVLSMSVTYAGAGVLAGYAGSYVQAFLQNMWVLIIFSVLFFLLALSLFGFYELRMPHALQNKLHEFSNRHEGGTYFGVAMMGFFATLVVSPCVTAPLIGVLSYIGNTGNMLVGGIALFVMGLGMGLPLLIVGTGGGKLLPKSGAWLHEIKVILGILLIGVSIWMLSRIVSDTISVILVSALVISTAIYSSISAVKYRGHFAKILQIVSILLFIYGFALLVGVLMGNASLLQPIKMKQISAEQHQQPTKVSFITVKNMADIQAKLSEAKSQHKPVFLDFYADWCISCKMMDRFVLTDPQVIDLLQNYILLRVDMTSNSADDIAVAKHYKMIGPPVVIFYDANGQQIQPAIVGEVTTKELVQSLQQVLSSQN